MKRLWTPPHARGVSTLAQSADLFPHLSVLENVAFGARSKGLRKPRRARVARHWLSEVDAAPLASRRPAELSGGQAQRIAVARALASDPKLLLLDEPLSALDVASAPAIRRTLLRVLEDRTAIIVTHDILDALTLADRVVVLSHGRIVEQGPTRATLERPRTPFTASLAALNLLTGIRTAHGMTTGAGDEIVSSVVSEAVGRGCRRRNGAAVGRRIDRARSPRQGRQSTQRSDPGPRASGRHHPRPVRCHLCRPHPGRGRRRGDHDGCRVQFLLPARCGDRLSGHRAIGPPRVMEATLRRLKEQALGDRPGGSAHGHVHLRHSVQSCRTG